MTKKSAPKRHPAGDGGSIGKAVPNTSRTRWARLARTLIEGVCKVIWAAVARSAIETLWSWLSP
ncbi:hypothetical protein [Streptomyces sp. WMMC940]|uniref:hypothetical protein n=1 Tax=Streptomyces sp. WMMC940 TaxID=3015153 RepID=UPI0022B6BE02|nr:hypothetical protein [Streptomyces sp. WMMC940]MCZ7460609.1 hypothetical protein [Streptomyces sp. WMMC940]